MGRITKHVVNFYKCVGISNIKLNNIAEWLSLS